MCSSAADAKWCSLLDLVAPVVGALAVALLGLVTAAQEKEHKHGAGWRVREAEGTASAGAAACALPPTRGAACVRD